MLASESGRGEHVPPAGRAQAQTADHHIQHVYAKIGVSSRGAAVLWAVQHDLVS